MSFQFYTSEQDGAILANGFNGFWSIVSELMTIGRLCYKVDAINVNEITINNGFDLCEHTTYIATNGTNSIGGIHLTKKDINTLIANKDLSLLNGDVEIRTDPDFGWDIFHDKQKSLFSIRNAFGGFTFDESGEYVNRYGLTKKNQDMRPYILSSRYKIVFNEKMIFIVKDYAVGSGASILLLSDENSTLINSYAGSAAFEVQRSVLHGISNIDGKEKEFTSPVLRVSPKVVASSLSLTSSLGDEKFNIQSDVIYHYGVLNNISTWLNNLDISIDKFGAHVKKDADSIFLFLYNNYGTIGSNNIFTLRFDNENIQK